MSEDLGGKEMSDAAQTTTVDKAAVTPGAALIQRSHGKINMTALEQKPDDALESIISEFDAMSEDLGGKEMSDAAQTTTVDKAAVTPGAALIQRSHGKINMTALEQKPDEALESIASEFDAMSEALGGADLSDADQAPAVGEEKGAVTPGAAMIQRHYDKVQKDLKVESKEEKVSPSEDDHVAPTGHEKAVAPHSALRRLKHKKDVPKQKHALSPGDPQVTPAIDETGTAFAGAALLQSSRTRHAEL
eukprot:gnl/TRDRNA2_/TRDRNA2_131961_c0_seq1.p1 gnl/TRDRNA2_/TRDRNA2_131961_c0~~gnl/TRDRNA2_/TRDRNA2_131961_c0_seq1.p1  ORF type:complete len:258 (-),score=73.28 gnl/TRDRNA2_/TRDRNA2_131961_c0_seq1:20-760(-)